MIATIVGAFLMQGVNLYVAVSTKVRSPVDGVYAGVIVCLAITGAALVHAFF